MNVETFKKQLSSYRDFKKVLLRVNSEISDVLYELTGVKGVRFDRSPSSYNPNLAETKRLELVDKYNEKLLEKEYIEKGIEFIEYKLSKMEEDDKKIVLAILADNVSYERMGGKVGYSRTGIWSKVQRDLKKIL